MLVKRKSHPGLAADGSLTAYCQIGGKTIPKRGSLVRDTTSVAQSLMSLLISLGERE
jgi:hypothetical protein